ncbi:hypothetical protein BDV10DRAFT_115379 [Aspergillus recurvatus]
MGASEPRFHTCRVTSLYFLDPLSHTASSSSSFFFCYPQQRLLYYSSINVYLALILAIFHVSKRDN